MGTPDTRVLEALTAFIRGVSHRVRTPLSVVSNDLSYFKSLIDPEECERSITRCREISTILREAGSCSSFSLEPRNITAKEFVSSLVTPHFPGSAQTLAGDECVRIDARLLGQVIGFLPLLFEKFGPSESTPPTASVRIDETTLVLEVIGDLRTGTDVAASEKREFRSLTGLFCVALDTDSFFPPMYDAVVWAHGADSKVIWTDRAQILLQLPVVQGNDGRG